ncbi:MAG: beta-galactosidase, partial [Bacteroidaceae bacterium]|nr:beta-galactosidase [Bacteroidaceae bacterium]
MKNIKTLFVLFVLLIVNCQWSIVNGRDVTSLNQEWQYKKGTFGIWGVFPDIMVPKGEKVVNLPHTFNAEDFLNDEGYYRGEGSYMKEIEVPESWKGKRIFVKFEGAGSVANVQINWNQVGQHKGAYNAFTYEITDYLT